MKAFKFQLDGVLNYKHQVLDALMVEHGTILARIREQTALLEAIYARYDAYNAEYTEKRESGMTIAAAMGYQVGLQALEMEIVRANERLTRLQAEEEKMRAKVVEAKIDTSSIEKLRKIKRGLYDKAVVKEEEAMLDELVASRRAVANA